jgi:hypothetical protein
VDIKGTIKIGQFTGNIGYTRHKTKINKTKNTTQEKNDEQPGLPTKFPGVNAGAREG